MIRCRLRLPNANILKRIYNSLQRVCIPCHNLFLRTARSAGISLRDAFGRKLIFINLKRAAIKTVI